MNQIKEICLIILLAGVLCLGLMLVTEGFAADKNPCSDDIAKFCPDVQPSDRGAIMNCLEAHENELSDTCRDYEVKMEGTRGERREFVRQQRAIYLSCKGDVAIFCKDVDPKEGGILKCLNEHGKELSAPCQESLSRAKGEEKKTQ